MNKKIQKGVSKDLKKDLESIEINSNITKATVIDIIYPNKKVNYNEEFEIKLVLELLDDTKEEVYVYCPSISEYSDSNLKVLQEYTGVDIYNFAEENIDIPVKYNKNELEINYDEMRDNENKKYMLTEKGNDYVINIVFVYMITMAFVFGINEILIICLFVTYLLYWAEAYHLSDSNSIIELV